MTESLSESLLSLKELSVRNVDFIPVPLPGNDN